MNLLPALAICQRQITANNLNFASLLHHLIHINVASTVATHYMRPWCLFKSLTAGYVMSTVMSYTQSGEALHSSTTHTVHMAHLDAQAFNPWCHSKLVQHKSRLSGHCLLLSPLLSEPHHQGLRWWSCSASCSARVTPPITRRHLGSHWDHS